MQKTNRISSFLKTIMYVWVAFQIVACGGGSGGSGIAAGDAGGGVAAATLADDIQIAGSVGDGPVTGATVEVWNVRGEMIGSMRSDNTASFRSRIRVRRSSYPLLLKVRGGTDLVSGRAPDFQMLSVMQNRYTRQVNINPFSTLIVKIAQSLPGGLNRDNIRAASGFVMQTSAYGLDAAVISDPVSAALTDDNVANLMKASEAMGEMVRRTRDRMRAAGLQVSGNGVMDALAADMKDGRLDGRGAAGTNSRLTAVAKVVSGQVMVEALSNNLKVDGVVATSVIDEAIRITRPGVESNALTHSVRITDNALKQTLAAIAAASVVDPGAEVVGLAAVVSGIRSGASSADAATVLPAESSRAFDNSLQLVTTASQGQIDRVNTAEDLVTEAPAPQAPAPEEPAPKNPHRRNRTAETGTTGTRTGRTRTTGTRTAGTGTAGTGTAGTRTTGARTAGTRTSRNPHHRNQHRKNLRHRSRLPRRRRHQAALPCNGRHRLHGQTVLPCHWLTSTVTGFITALRRVITPTE